MNISKKESDLLKNKLFQHNYEFKPVKKILKKQFNYLFKRTQYLVIFNNNKKCWTYLK